MTIRFVIDNQEHRIAGLTKDEVRCLEEWLAMML